MKEFYNAPRVLAHFLDLWDEEEITQELNFPTFPFSSQKEADLHTKNEINIWIVESGNRKNDTELELSYWEAI